MKRFTYLVKERSLSSGYDDSCIWTTGSRLSWISSLEKKEIYLKYFMLRKESNAYFKDYEI